MYRGALRRASDQQGGRESMSSFAPLLVLVPHHFEIVKNRRVVGWRRARKDLSAECSAPRKMRFALLCLKSGATAPAFKYFHLNRRGAEVQQRDADEQAELSVRQAVLPLDFDPDDGQALSRRAHLRPPEARPKILSAGLTSTAKVLPHLSRSTSKRILCPTTDDITVRSLPVT